MNGRTARIGGVFAAGLAAFLMTVAGSGVRPSGRAGDAAAEQPGSGAGRKAGQEKAPVRISADAAEYHNKGNTVIFMGNVVASQSDSTLTADRMELVFTPAEDREGASRAPDPGGTANAEGEAERSIGAIGEPSGRQLKTITALKNVSFRQVDAETRKERYATGDKAVYDADKQEVTMTGSPKLWEGRNVIAGEEMIFNIEGQDVIFKGKVNLIVFPDDVEREQRP